MVIEGVTDDKDAGEIFKETGVIELLDREMRLTDSDYLIMREYPNLLPEPHHFASMTASEYIKDYDCVISLASGKMNGAPSLQNLTGIFPQAQYKDAFQQMPLNDLLSDVYFTIGHYFHGFVVDMSEQAEDESIPGKVMWGEDCLAVDEVACQMMKKPVPDIIESIRQRQKQVTSE